MINSVAFQSGVFYILATTVFVFLIWILAAFNKIRVERIGILYSSFIDFYKIKINSTEIILGSIPTGSYVKLSGMLDENSSESVKTEPKEYEFRGKPFITKFVTIFSSLLVQIGIGYFVLSAVSPINVSEIISIYFQISSFYLPLEAGNAIWEQLYTNPTFLLGFIFLFTGIANLFTNLTSLFNFDDNILNYLQILMLLVMFLFALVFLRLAWVNLSVTNILYYCAGALLMGIITTLFSIVLAKILPNC